MNEPPQRSFGMLRIIPLVAIAITACGPEGPRAGSDGEELPPTRDDTGTTTQPPAEPGEIGSATIAGRVVEDDGEPAEGVKVTLCHGGCRFLDTDADGRFTYTEVPADSYALHFTTFGEGGWAEVLVAIDVSDDEVLDFESAFPLAALGGPTEVSGPGEVEIVDGVWLDIDPSDVELPPFGPDTLELAGAEPTVPPPALPSDEVVAVWYLSPFDATADPGMGFRALNRWDLQAGEELALYASSYSDYAWLDAGVVTVGADGLELTGGSIPVLSTLVLARKP